MTENEAIEELREQIETAESMISFNMDFEPKHDNSVLENKIKTAKIAISALEEIQQYRAIGTVEEGREARKKQIPKKPNKRQVGTNILMSKIYYCPICDKKLYDCAIKKGKLDYVSPGSKKSKFCEDCGQAIDWSETV